MKKIKIYQVDSFTKEILHGNPAGVVPFADGLSEEEMQRIARELNNSETAFIFKSSDPSYNHEVRFFTPTGEVPLCGHATVAAHYVMAHEGIISKGRVFQKTKAGILPVDITEENGDYSVVMTQGTPFVGESFSSEERNDVLNALHLSEKDMRDDTPMCIASAGHSKIMIGIKSIDTLNNLSPDMEELKSISKKVGCNGYYVFTLNPEDKILVHGRMFAPAIGITEDPVTGNANGPLGIYLVHNKIAEELYKESSFNFSIIQGEAIKRDGTMDVHVEITDGKPILVQITGKAVIAFSCEIII